VCAGADVTPPYVETYGRTATEAQIRDLPIIPRKQVAYRGSLLEEMDLQAILARRPAVALIDELAHTNVAVQQPGSVRRRFWVSSRAIMCCST
jgi:two-component system, OmpR family, sensor histidine kinase KdpD